MARAGWKRRPRWPASSSRASRAARPAAGPSTSAMTAARATPLPSDGAIACSARCSPAASASRSGRRVAGRSARPGSRPRAGTAPAAPRVRRPQVPVRPVDQVRVPPRRVLVGQRDEPSVGVQPGRGARRGKLDEGGEPVRLRVGGRAPGEDLGQVQRLRRRQAPGLRPGRGPVDDVRAVDRLEDRGHPRRKLVRARDAKRNAGRLDPLLRPDQAGRHRRGRHRERPADLLGGEAEHGAEHQRRVRGGVDCRVRAHQHQLEPPVGKRVDVEVVGVSERVLTVVERQRPLRRGGLPVIAQPVAGDGQQPGVGAGRRPPLRPGAQGALERVRERVFGGRDIAARGGEQRQQPPVTVPSRQARRLGRPGPPLAAARRPPGPSSVVSASTRH